jgi:hypothetical protein
MAYTRVEKLSFQNIGRLYMGKQISVCYEGHIKHIITLRGQNAEILCVKVLHVVTFMFEGFIFRKTIYACCAMLL